MLRDPRIIAVALGLLLMGAGISMIRTRPAPPIPVPSSIVQEPPPFDCPSTNKRIGGGGVVGIGEPRVDVSDQTLEWLAGKQHANGSWEGSVRTTGQVLLAFTSSSQTHKHGRFKRNVRQGFRWLSGRQCPPLAVAALCEDYALTGSPLFKEPATKAVAALFRDRSLNASNVGLRALVYASARMAGLPTPDTAKEGIVEWGPLAPDPAARAMASVALGQPISEEDLQGILSTDVTSDEPMFVLLATLATRSAGSLAETAPWRAEVRSRLPEQMERDGGDRGSWAGNVSKTALLHAAHFTATWSFCKYFNARRR